MHFLWVTTDIMSRVLKIVTRRCTFKMPKKQQGKFPKCFSLTSASSQNISCFQLLTVDKSDFYRLRSAKLNLVKIEEDHFLVLRICKVNIVCTHDDNYLVKHLFIAELLELQIELGQNCLCSQLNGWTVFQLFVGQRHATYKVEVQKISFFGLWCIKLSHIQFLWPFGFACVTLISTYY